MTEAGHVGAVPLELVADGVMNVELGLLAATALAVANAGAGILVH